MFYMENEDMTTAGGDVTTDDAANDTIATMPEGEDFVGAPTDAPADPTSATPAATEETEVEDIAA